MSLNPFKKESFVGIDLGHHTIKAIALEQIPSGWKITGSGTAPTPTGTIREGIVSDPSTMADAIRGLLRTSGIKASTAHVSVAGASVIVRNVRVPRMNEATMRKSIRFEAARYVPTSVEDSYIEFEILGDADNGEMDVMMVTAPRDLVNSRIAACRIAGLDVESVDVEPFAAYRSLIEANIGIDVSNETFVMLDLGAHSTKMSVIHKGMFAMTRSISHGGSVLTEALQRYFNLEFADAEEGKSQLDVRELLDDSKPQENPPLRVLQPHLDELVRELKRSFNYYQSQQAEAGGGGTISWMLICGGGAKLRGIADYVSHRLNLKVYAAGIYDNPRFASLVPAIGQGTELSVASGLAMRSFVQAA